MNGYRPFAVSIIGGSHTKHGKGCQDFSLKYEDEDMSIASVADGHGEDNCFRSARGAVLAVTSAINGIHEFVKYHEVKFAPPLFKKKIILSQDEWDKALRDLVRRIIASWQVKVEEDYTARPFSPEELSLADEKHRKRFEAGNGLNKAYGTTLLACAITQYYWFGIHIGDGRFSALYPDGSFDQPVPWDERCYLNVTTSICDDDADKSARLYFSLNTERKPPVAVFICTDGIDDNYPVDGNEKHLFKLYRTIALTFAEDGFESTDSQLKDLAISFATKGKGDDTSIAGFIDMEALNRVVPVWQKQVKEEEVGEKSARMETQEATAAKIETEEPKEDVARNASSAIAAYEKQMGTFKRDDLSYGDFITKNEKT